MMRWNIFELIDSLACGDEADVPKAIFIAKAQVTALIVIAAIGLLWGRI